MPAIVDALHELSITGLLWPPACSPSSILARCLQLLAPLVKSGFLTQAEVDGGLDKCLAAFPEDRDALKAEIATRATA